MWRLTLRTARAHWRRFVLTTVAVVVGVSFVVGSFVLTDTLAAGINRLLADTVARTDFVVRAGDGGGGAFGGGFGGPRSGVPVELVEEVAAVPGVAAADGVVTGAAQLLDKAGRAGEFDISFVSDWPDEPRMFGVRLVEGAAPEGRADVVIDTTTARDRDLRLGSPLRVATRRGVIGATVSGLAERGGGALGTGAPILAFTEARATELVGLDGRVGGINVQLSEGAERDRVRVALEDVVGVQGSVLSADALLAEAQELIEEQLNTFNGLLLGFAVVTLFVSSFLIWNTFSVVVAQRTRELALLRAVGASRGQIARSVIGEGLVIGVVASALGVIAGIGLAALLRSLIGGFGISLPGGPLEVAGRTVASGLVVGIGVTAVSVLGPARRATAVAPVEALASVGATPARRDRRVPVLGTVLLTLGVVQVARTLADADAVVDARVRGVALGALLVFLGVAGVARHLAGPLIGALGAPLVRLGGVTGRMARRNAVRNPRRTASTGSALMIGLALVATTLVVGESVKTALGGALTRSLQADVVVDSGSIAPFDTDTLEALAAAPSVDEAVPLLRARADLARRHVGRVGLSTGDLDRLLELVAPELSAGRAPVADDEVALSTRFADQQGLAPGDELVLDVGEVRRGLTVVGIYRREELLDEAVVRPGALAGLPGVEPVARQVFVRTGGPPARVADELARVAATVPNSSARTVPEFVEDRTGSVDVVLSIVNVLLLFAVLVAGLGIANTMALAVVERVHELGLLRAVGMTRRRMRRMVRVEGVLIALFGGVLGLVVGLAFGAVLVAALPVETAELTFPVPRLALLVLAAGLLGVLASAAPARRAGRLDVLAAIAEE